MSAPARSIQHVAGQVEDWLARETALGRPEALIAESLAGDPIGLVVVRVDRQRPARSSFSSWSTPARWGQGLGTDVVQTALEACFAGWGLHRIGAPVEVNDERAGSLPQPSASWRRADLREAAYRDGQHQDVLLLGTPRGMGRS